jgi:hypothetical protein
MRYLTTLLFLAAGFTTFAADTEHSLPIFFVPNSGQTNPLIRYIVQTREMSAGFALDSAIFQIHGTQLREHFASANPSVAIQGLDTMAARANFLIGDDPAAWHTSLPTYRGIIYRNLYSGIDMTYTGDDPKMKSEFLIAPGADAGQIRLEYPTADRVFVDDHGDLVVRAGAAELREQAPTAYQEWDGVRHPVRAAYRILGDIAAFDLADYDVTRPLVIDPVISYSTYIGGTAQSAITALAVDTAGDLYAAGWTEAIDFPVSNAIQAVNRGGVDAFVFKLNPAGSSLLYATYIGGRGDDRAAAIAVDSASGQIYIAGSTASIDFPLVSSIRPTLGGTRDAFVVKLNAIGNLMLYSTYLGGSGYDAATAIAIDTAGNAYIVGDTQSTDFPLVTPVQPVSGGAMDAFVTKLNSAGALSFSSYLGGANDEHAGGVAVDASANIYVAGGTFSVNFPLAAPLQAANGGSQDAFVTKISTSPAKLVYSTFLGGTGGQIGSPEQANAIAVDSAGSAYVAGVTNSINFPVTPGAFQTIFNGVEDAFVTKLNAAGSAQLYGTYLGSSSFDWASGLAVDSNGNAYVAGYTSSAGFPVVSPVQPGFNGFYDAFVSQLNPQGNGLTFSTMYGGTGADQANAIALDTLGNMFIGGQTSSLDFPLQGAIQSSNVGGSTGWVARLGVTAGPPQIPAANSVAPSSGSGNTVTFTAQYSHPAGATSLTTVGLLLNTTASLNFACYVTYSPATNLFTLANDDGSTGGSANPGGANLQNSQCMLNGAGSSANLAGTNLTLGISLTFQANFAGSKTVYLFAADAHTNTGFLAKGTWSVIVPPPLPSADSVSPNASSGAGQTFTFVFSDTQNASNLADMAVLFNTSVSFTNACYIIYDRNAASITLLADDGVGAGSKPVSSTTVLQNSQCAVGVVSVSASGLSEILNIAVTFKGAFIGLKNIYMFASEATVNTGWVQRGTYFVAAGGIPVANSVVPSAGFGPGQRFSFTVSDQGGSGFIVAVAMLFAPTLNLNNACSLVYDRTVNTISLAFDNPANGAAPLVPGSSTVVSNHQCTLRGANSTVVAGTTALVVTVDLVFNAAYFGAKNTYLYAAETSTNSGYATVGSWTVTGGAPTADSVVPASGSGPSPNFVFTVSDSALDLNIVGMNLLVTAGSPANLANACYLLYNRTTSTIGLYGDDGITLNTKGIGSATTLQNTQCAVGFTVVNVSGNSVSLTINLVFKSPAFSGAKSVYLQALEPNSSSGWVFRGTWTVP